ncbi:MAG: Na+/H+ antiporter subunit E [Oscillospiraceae bacterium]|nr:Na+/H+ antiporter subunit E [Oscillospiraceae bacterium]
MYILLFLLWIALNGRITLEICIFGVAISAFVYRVMCKFLDYSPKNDIIFIRRFPLVVEYIFVLFVEIIKSSIIALKIVYSKKIDIQPQVVFFDVPLKSEFMRTILANSITLTPGTITVDLDEDHFCVHALDYTMTEGIEDSVFVRLLMKMEEIGND